MQNVKFCILFLFLLFHRSIFILGSLYSHFAPVDILMATGILGGVITIIICVGMFRDFMYFLKEKTNVVDMRTFYSFLY